MRNKLYSACIFLASVLAIAGCCKKRNYCNPEALKIYLTGFDRATVRSVMLKRYATSDSVRAKALDSSIFIYSGTTPVPPVGKKDTVYFGDYTTTTGTLTGVYSGNVWVLIVQATGYHYTFDAIGDNDHRYEIVQCKDKKAQCTLGIDHFALNGGYHTDNTAYIQK